MRAIGLASAFRTLTILPFPGWECKHQATTLYWFTVVGAVLGGLSYTLAWMVGPAGSPILSGALITALLAFLTRAFHLDGLADTADGFGGGWTRERRLLIMKDSHTGAFGVVALVGALLVKCAAIAAICDFGNGYWIFIILVLSRYFLVFQTVINPYARPEGGTAGALVIESRLRHLLVATLQIVTAAWIFLPSRLLRGVLLVFATGLAMTLIVAMMSRRKIGGITGDVLGATCELSEVAMCVTAALLIGLK
jgi:adenosylcobinamide-GDP ribazoletransferase